MKEQSKTMAPILDQLFDPAGGSTPVLSTNSVPLLKSKVGPPCEEERIVKVLSDERNGNTSDLANSIFCLQRQVANQSVTIKDLSAKLKRVVSEKRQLEEKLSALELRNKCDASVDIPKLDKSITSMVSLFSEGSHCDETSISMISGKFLDLQAENERLRGYNESLKESFQHFKSVISGLRDDNSRLFSEKESLRRQLGHRRTLLSQDLYPDTQSNSKEEIPSCEEETSLKMTSFEPKAAKCGPRVEENDPQCNARLEEVKESRGDILVRPQYIPKSRTKNNESPRCMIRARRSSLPETFSIRHHASEQERGTSEVTTFLSSNRGLLDRYKESKANVEIPHDGDSLLVDWVSTIDLKTAGNPRPMRSRPRRKSAK